MPSTHHAAAALVSLSAALAAGLLAHALPPEARPDPVHVEAGKRHDVVFPEGARVDERLTWQTEVDLDADPDAYEIDVRVPYRLEVTPGDAEGTSVHLAVNVDGEPAADYRLLPGVGDVAVDRPGPDVDASLFHEGTNEVHARVDLQRSPEAPGNNDITVGPLLVEASPRGEAGLAPTATMLGAAFAGGALGLAVAKRSDGLRREGPP